MSTFLFAVFPYLAMAVFVVGMIWPSCANDV